MSATIETSIVIPTYRRPEHLARVLASCCAQQGDVGEFEIVVVDNDAAESARPLVAQASRTSAIPIRYVPEPRRGISNARNTGVAQARGRYVAFIDDDEETDPSWLCRLLATIRACAADAVTGPVYPRLPPGAPPLSLHQRRIYTRDARVPTGTPLARWSGIGNTLLDKTRCFTGPEPFDPRLGLSGGEDSLFLRGLFRRGRRIVWCAEAAAWESLSQDRLDTAYLLRRAFRSGQTYTFVCTATDPAEWPRATGRMAVGAAQAVVYGAIALPLRLVNRGASLALLMKAVTGLGKLCWHPRMHLRLYR